MDYKIGDKLLCKDEYWDIIDYYTDNSERWGYRFKKGKWYTIVEIRYYRYSGEGPHYILDETYYDPEIITCHSLSEEKLNAIFYNRKELRKLKLQKLK